MSTRITNKSRYAEILALCHEAGKADLATWVEERMNQLDKRNATPHKPSKAQQENDQYRATMVEAMEPEVKYSVSDLANLIGIPGASSQKMVGLMKSITCDADKDADSQFPIHRVKEGRNTFFVKA